MLVFFSPTVPHVGLASPCFASDVCEDVNAICWLGQCQCITGYYEQNNRCGNVYSLDNHKIVSCAIKIVF